LLLLLVVAASLFLAGLGSLPLLEPDEGRNAEVAREMLASGDWLTPHFNTFTYLDKPPVHFWLVATAFKLCGIREWAARAPSVLMALATLLLVWFLARRMFGDSAGLRAGLVLATCPLVMAFSRLVIFDMTLLFFLTLAMASFWLAEAADFRALGLEALMFAAMGVATITKGPVGFLLPLLSILAYQAVRGRLGELKRLRWGLGLGVFLAVVLPWFIAVSVRHPDFPRYALWQESLRRFATGELHRKGGLLYYLPVYFAGFFPWSLFLVFAGWNRLKRWRELKQEANRSAVFLLIWAVVVFLFFTISQSKLPGYFLPAVVPLSILLAQTWEEVKAIITGRSPDWLTAGFAALLGLGLLVALASQPWVLTATKRHLARTLHPTLMALVRPSILYTGLILIALAIIGRNLAARARGTTLSLATFTLLALTVPMLAVRWRLPIRIYAETHSSRQLAETLLASPEKDLPLYGYYYFRTSLPFYLRRPVGLVSADGGEMTSHYVVAHWPELRRRQALATATPSAAESRMPQRGLERAGPGEQLLPDFSELRPLAQSSPQPLLILVRNTHVGQLAKVVGRIEPLWNEWEYSIWKVPAGKHE
jgi:4-amino-4-deoxy-L-arabinose transferase-like glycosyltransferase